MSVGVVEWERHLDVAATSVSLLQNHEPAKQD